MKFYLKVKAKFFRVWKLKNSKKDNFLKTFCLSGKTLKLFHIALETSLDVQNEEE
jgi:hypothetical protein